MPPADPLGLPPTTAGIPGADQRSPGGAVEGVAGPEVSCNDLLDFERHLGAARAGIREQAIRDRFRIPAIRYYQMLNAALDDPAAIRHDPVTVNRLLRIRAAGRGGRKPRP